jgi:hypothetical protein
MKFDKKVNEILIESRVSPEKLKEILIDAKQNFKGGQRFLKPNEIKVTDHITPKSDYYTISIDRDGKWELWSDEIPRVGELDGDIPNWAKKLFYNKRSAENILDNFLSVYKKIYKNIK